MQRITGSIEQGPRARIEDAARAFVLQVPDRSSEAFCLLVADGVGGEQGGEVASQLGAMQLTGSIAAHWAGAGQINAHADDDPEIVARALRDALFLTNANLVQRSREEPALRGMATTVVCALIIGNVVHVAWAGDSRCYIVGKDSICRATADHSHVAELLAHGVITQAEAPWHPLAHRITQYLGMPSGFCPDTQAHPLQTDDLVILCTDGLTDVVSDDAILAHVSAYRHGEYDLAALPQRLAEAALSAGTRDNVTVLCCNPWATDSIPTNPATKVGQYRVELAKTVRRLAQENANGHEKRSCQTAEG
jgi:serine/threonine protein phosphatase PrpC